MLRTASALLIAGTLALPRPASAQRAISVGETLRGTLTAEDPVLDDASHYHIYTFHAHAGQRYLVTLGSEAFDTYLAVAKGAQGAGPQCSEEAGCRSDDDGGDGTNSRIVFTADEDAVYSIRVNSLAGGETGDYTLSVTEHNGTGHLNRQTIRVGAEVAGDLDDGDALADDESYYEEWFFRPDFSGSIVISMQSSDFDTYLKWGMGSGSDFEQMDFNDDADGDQGTNSELTVEVTAGTEYTIQANSLGGGETGHYTLSVRRSTGPKPHFR